MADKRKIVRIFIADDHPIFRDAIKTLLECENGFHIIGNASDGNKMQDQIVKYNPDILLLDKDMPNISGMEVLKSLAESKSTVKSILLCDIAGPEDIIKIFALGARGIVMKESASYVLINSIKAVVEGKYWVNLESVSNPEKKLKGLKKTINSPRVPDNYGLTPREMDVIRTVVSGYPNKQVAVKLGISEQTVKHHITNIFDKLGVYNRLELTLFVFHHGLVEN